MASCVVSAVSVSGVALSILCGASLARAEGARDQDLPASDALPGIHRVGIARTAPAAVAGTFGYGFTEPQPAARGTHHRLSLRAAAAVPVASWLGVGAVVDGRYDQHRDDSGGLVDTALQARLSADLGAWQLGGSIVGRLPGAESFGAMTRGASLDVQALLSTTLGPVRIAGMGGYRLNRSGANERNAARLSPGDRLALGVSDFDSLLFGVGIEAWLGKNELLVEVSADPLLGSRVPGFLQSPLRLAAGVRRAVSARLSFECLAVASLSKQPDLSAGAPLVPNEPRISAFGGLRYQFSPQQADPKPIAHRPQPVPSRSVGPRLELLVRDEQGAPVANPSAFTLGGERRDLVCDDGGRCHLEDAPIGELVVHIEAPDFEPAERTLTLQAGAPSQVEVRLSAVPPPSQLRGMVRSLDGKAVLARVRVEPSGAVVHVDDTGAFQLDLPPGGYDVVIEAPGYVTQRRHVQVEQKGVLILNADLMEKR